MQTEAGDIWDGWGDDVWVVVPLNHTVRNDGRLVMGRGVARQAVDRIPECAVQFGMHTLNQVEGHPGIVVLFDLKLIGLFVKQHWRDQASHSLIVEGLKSLRSFAIGERRKIRLPLLGAGFGELSGRSSEGRIEEADLPDNVTLVLRASGVKRKYPKSFKGGGRHDRS